MTEKEKMEALRQMTEQEQEATVVGWYAEILLRRIVRQFNKRVRNGN